MRGVGRLGPGPDSQTSDGILLRRLPALGDTVRLSLAAPGIQPTAPRSPRRPLIAVSGGNEQQPYRKCVSFTNRPGKPAPA